MKIEIIGEITDQKCDGCFSPIDLKEQLESVDVNEPLEVTITSEGGSVFAGMQIANMLSRHQGDVTTHAVGLCASIATVILMTGDRIVVDDSCFCLIHLPWSCVQGNANDLAKEIDALKKCEAAMMGYYTKHLKTDETTLAKYLEDETWFLGKEFAEIFDVEVVPADKVFNIAAKCNIKKFKNLPKVFNMEEKEEKKTEEILEQENKENIEEVLEEVEKQPEEIEEQIEEQTEEQTEEVEEQKPTYEELEKKIEELEAKLAEYEKEDEDVVTKDECEKRVSGMQASMQKQVNDFKNQLTAKDGELTEAKALVTSLESELEKAKSELSKTASALADKENALAELNAGVNKPAEQKFDPNGWRNLKGQAFWDFLKKHPEVKNQK